MSYNRLPNENFLDYADRLITGVKDKEYDLDKSEIFEFLYGTKVSSDHARKALTVLENTIEKIKADKVNENPDEINTTYKTKIEINNDGTITSDKLLVMSEENCKDVNFLLKAHGYDTKAWILINARNNIWNVYSKQDGVSTLYSSKITVKPATEYVWNEEDVLKIFESLKSEYKDKLKIEPKQYNPESKDVLIVPIADFHYGLYSDMYSNGNDYNLEIAEELYYRVLNDVINRNKHRTFKKVAFIVGNDFVNSDNLNNTTTKGTPQDNTGLWFSIVKKATQLIINATDMLQTVAPVDVVYVTSNHDLHTMFGIMQTIKAWYRDNDNVTVDDSPLPRKYYKFGEVLLPLSHDIKINEALKIISTEAKEDWSTCKHIICLLAHLHKAMIYDKEGYLEIYRLPTISGWSRWTNSMGYVQTEKKNQSFVINSKLGITDVINTIL